MIIAEYSELSDLAVEAAQNDGRLARRPLKSWNREIQAHQVLLSWITRLINEYNTSIKVHVTTFTLFISRYTEFTFSSNDCFQLWRQLEHHFQIYSILASIFDGISSTYFFRLGSL